MPASYTIRRSVPRNTRRSKPASTPSTCFPSFSINLFMAFPLPLVICLPTQQTSYGNRKRHHRLVAAMPRYTTNLEIVFLAQRFFSSRLGNQLFEGGVTRREDGIEDQTSVFGDLIAMRVGKFLNQPVGAQ